MDKRFPYNRFPVRGIPASQGTIPTDKGLQAGVYFIASDEEFEFPDPTPANWTQTTTRIDDGSDGDETTWEPNGSQAKYVAVLIAYDALTTIASVSIKLQADTSGSPTLIGRYSDGSAMQEWGTYTITPGLGVEFTTCAADPTNRSTRYVGWLLNCPAGQARISDVALVTA